MSDVSLRKRAFMSGWIGVRVVTCILVLSVAATACHSESVDPDRFDSAITGGEISAAFAATGAIRYNGSHICTATLVSPNMIMTAAHCFHQAQPNMIKQSEFVLGIDVANAKVRSNLDWAKQHEDFDYNDSNFIYDGPDVAVAALQTPIVSVKPVVLNDLNPGGWIGQDMLLVGYGKAANENNNVSKRRHATVVLAGTNNTKVYYEYGGTGACNGDSGGPAFMLLDGLWQQVGITSGGENSCTQEGYYTRVDTFAGWFQDNQVPSEVFEDRERYCAADAVCDGICLTDEDCSGLMCEDGTCQDPPDPCAQDGVCNEGCENDPDCDLPDPCAEDGVCNEECEDDLDCASQDPCAEDGACNQDCHYDPDCYYGPMCYYVYRTVDNGYCYYWDYYTDQFCGAYRAMCYPWGCYCPY